MTNRVPHKGDGTLPPGAWKAIAVATIGSFMVNLDGTIINVSLAGLAQALQATLSTIQWTMSGYLLALALILPLNGWLVDRIGARALYLWCFASFTLASALCGLAWSVDALIGFRVLQGLSGGLLAPMAQLTAARVAGKQLPRVSSLMTVPILLAPMLGPVVAGFVLQHGSWRWLFLLNLPVGAIAFALAVAFLPDDDAEQRPRSLDVLGLILISPAMVLFLVGADHLRARIGELAFFLSVVMLASYGFHAWRRADAALIDLRLFRIRTFSVSAIAMFLLNGVMFAGQMLVPVYLIQACRFSATDTGLLMLPLGLGMIAVFLVLGRVTDRFGMRGPALSGALLALAGTVPLVFLAETTLSVPVLAASLFLRGVGLGAIAVPATSSGYAAIAREDLSSAATAMNIGQRLGGPTWMTLFATFLGWRLSAGGTQAALPHAFGLTFALLCVVHAVLLLSTLPLPRVLPDRQTGSTSDAAKAPLLADRPDGQERHATSGTRRVGGASFNGR